MGTWPDNGVSIYIEMRRSVETLVVSSLYIHTYFSRIPMPYGERRASCDGWTEGSVLSLERKKEVTSAARVIVQVNTGELLSAGWLQL